MSPYRRLIFILPALLLGLISQNNATAQALGDAGPKLPIFTETTYGLMQVDLSKVDVAALRAWIQAMPAPAGVAVSPAEMQKNLGQAVNALSTVKNKLKTASAEMMYFTLGQANGGALGYIPCGKGSEANVASAFGPIPMTTSAELGARGPYEGIAMPWGDGVIIGSVAPIKEIVAATVGAPQLTFPLRGAGPAAVIIVFSPTDDLRQMIETSMPQLPPPINLSSKALMDAISNAVLKVQPPPNLGVKLVIQAQDAASAATLKQAIQGAATLLIAQLKSQPGMQIDEAALQTALTPTVQEDQLTFEVKDPALTQLIAGPLMLSMVRSQETANRVKCASNMRSVGQAMLLYSNEHKGKYPDTMGQLIVDEDITVECFICPSSKAIIPPEVKNGTAKQKSDWVNANSDYTYLGKGKTSAAGPPQVLIYEKDADHQNGMNCLFGDGHVEYNLLDPAHKLIQGN